VRREEKGGGGYRMTLIYLFFAPFVSLNFDSFIIATDLVSFYPFQDTFFCTLYRPEHGPQKLDFCHALLHWRHDVRTAAQKIDSTERHTNLQTPDRRTCSILGNICRISSSHLPTTRRATDAASQLERQVITQSHPRAS
jgi:hypothetical protein